MATRLEISFPTIREPEYRVYIDDSSYSDPAVEIAAASDGFTLSHDGDSNNILDAIKGSRLEFTISVADDTLAEIESFATDLISAAEGRFTIRVDYNTGAPLAADELFWCGYVLPDLSGFEDRVPPYGFKVTATDGLGRLKGIDYADDSGSPVVPYGTLPVLDHILNILNTGELAALYFTGSDIFLRTSVNWVDDNMGGTPSQAKCPLAYSRISGELFAKQVTTNNVEEYEYLNCFDALKQILEDWQCQILFSRGCYRIRQIAEVAQSTFYERRFATDGTLISSTSTAGYDAALPQTSTDVRLTGGLFNYLPALKKVTANWDHKSHKNYLADMSGKWITGSASTSSVTIADVTTDADTYFLISGSIYMNLDLGDTYTVPWRYVIGLRVSKGSYYLTSNSFSVQNAQGDYLQEVGYDPNPPDWIASSNYVDISTDFITSDTHQKAYPFNIVTKVPPTGLADIVILFNPLNGYDLQESTLLTPVLNEWRILDANFYILKSSDPDTLFEVEREYVATNDTTGNTDFIEFEMTTGSNAQTWTPAKIQTTSDLVTWTDSDDTWQRNTAADAGEFGQLWAQQALALRKTPVQTFSGAVYSNDIYPHSRITFPDSTAWLMGRVTFSARTQTYTGEWIAAGITESGITGTKRKKGKTFPRFSKFPKALPGGAPTPTYEMSSGPGDGISTAVGLGTKEGQLALMLLTTNFVSTTLSAGAITSIPVREELNAGAYKDGDQIFVVNPDTGEVVSFEVSTTSNNGDTAIAVVSKVISNDMPVGSKVVYSTMNDHTTTGGGGINGMPAGTDTQTIRYNSTTPVANSILTNDGTQLGVNNAPVSGKLITVKQSSTTDGLRIIRSSSTASIDLYHNGSATVYSQGGNNLNLLTDNNALISLTPGGGSGQTSQISIAPANNLNPTGGNSAVVNVFGSYVQSSSGGDFSAFRIGTTINQTGSADQITRGLFVNPTLTAVASAGFRAVDYPASSQYFLYQGGGTGVTSYIQGAVGIGTGTSTPSAKVHIIGTGATSATTSLLIQNSSALAVIAARDDQRLGVATSSPAVTLDASGGTDGVAIPFGTTAQRPSVNNTIRTNTTAGGMEFRYSGAWHRLTSQVGPSIAAGAAAGTGPTVSINSGNDLCHEVSVTTGTSATTGTLCTVTFGAALDAGLFTYVVFTARNANAAGAIAKFYVGSAGNTSYTIACASAPADGTQYTFHVMVKQ